MRLTSYDIDQLCLFDDEMFRECFRGHPECTAELLKIILGMPNLRIINHKVEKALKNGSRRGVRLDVYAEDMDTKAVYNIEIQKRDTGNLPKRARYYSSLLDSKCTIKQLNDFESLPESFVIFICKDDIMGLGKGLYRFTRQSDGLALDDGSNILFVNGSYEGDDELGSLMKDLQERNSEKIGNSVLAGRFEEAREDIKIRRDKRMVVTHFDKLMEKSKNEGIAEGRVEGKAEGIAEGRVEGIAEGRVAGITEGRVESAQKLLELGKLTNEEIAQVTGLTIEQIEEMAKGA